MGKVLVKSAMYQYQMGPDGLQRYYTLGGSGGRAQPGEVRGRTKRDRALGLTGAVAGGLLGLAGESRSLSGFAGNVISGAEQGSRFGRGLANLATSRTRQARADMREQRRIDDTKQRAAELEERRAQGKGFNIPVPTRDDEGKLRFRDDEGKLRLGSFDLARLNPMARFRAGNYAVQQSEQEALDRANFLNQTRMATNEQLGRELARQGKDEYKQRMKGRQRDDDPAVEAVRNIDPERLQAAQRVLANVGIEAPQQQAQAPPLPPPPGSVASGEGTDADVNRTLANEGNMDHQMNTESIQSELGSQGDESEGGEPSEPTSTRMGRLGDREQDLFNEFMQQRGGAQ